MVVKRPPGNTGQVTLTKLKLRWPGAAPGNIRQWLSVLASSGNLHGIPPQVMAGIAQSESGYELQGAGVNSTGYGGFYGLHYFTGTPAGQYPSGTVSAATLESTNITSFYKQSYIASGNLADYIKQNTGTLEKAISEYVSGTPNKGQGKTSDWRLVAETVLTGYTTKSGKLLTYQAIATGQAGHYHTPFTPTTVTTNQTVGASTSIAKGSTGVAVLAMLTGMFNPTQKTGFAALFTISSDVGSVLKLLFARGLGTILFLGITVAGLYMIIKGPSGAIGSTVRLYQSGQRLQQRTEQLGQSRQRIDIQRQNTQLRQRTEPVRTAAVWRDVQTRRQREERLARRQK